MLTLPVETTAVAGAVFTLITGRGEEVVVEVLRAVTRTAGEPGLALAPPMTLVILGLETAPPPMLLTFVFLIGFSL